MTLEVEGQSQEGRWWAPQEDGEKGQARTREGRTGTRVPVYQVSLKSVFPLLSLTFLKDYQPAIAQGSPKRIVSDCNYQLGNVFKA